MKKRIVIAAIAAAGIGLGAAACSSGPTHPASAQQEAACLQAIGQALIADSAQWASDYAAGDSAGQQQVVAQTKATFNNLSSTPDCQPLTSSQQATIQNDLRSTYNSALSAENATP